MRPHQGRSLDYATLSIPGVFAAIEDLLAAARVAFIWEIDKYLIEAEREMERRGWTRHARLIWDKGNGIAPAFTVRFSHEYLVWWYRKPMMPIAIEERGRHTTLVRAAGREHSRKPDEAYALVERLYPEASRIDVFSRESRVGWGQWGDEPTHFPRLGLVG